MFGHLSNNSKIWWMLSQAVFEEQPFLSGVQLIIAETLAKIALKKPYLIFRKMSAPEKYE